MNKFQHFSVADMMKEIIRLLQDHSSSSRVFKRFWSAQILGLEKYQRHQLRQHNPQPAHPPVLWLVLGSWQHQRHGRYVTLLCFADASSVVPKKTLFFSSSHQIASTSSVKQLGRLLICPFSTWSTVPTLAPATEEITAESGNMLTHTGSLTRRVITTRPKTRVSVLLVDGVTSVCVWQCRLSLALFISSAL